MMDALSIIVCLIVCYWVLIGCVFMASDLWCQDDKEEGIFLKIIFNFGYVPALFAKECVTGVVYYIRRKAMSPCWYVAIFMSICILAVLYVKR